MFKKNIVLLILVMTGAFLLSGCSQYQSREVRTVSSFNSDWKFTLEGPENAQDPALDDQEWRNLDLPHDWSIEGEFSRKHRATPGGGALPGGVGWYRKAFTITPEDSGKCVYIDFDGIYMNSQVWVNGHLLGERPNGYISFRYDLTPWLHYGDEPNVLAVRVDNSMQPNSRWYSGSGIYRNVWLTTVDNIHVDHWGTFVTTPHITQDAAMVNIKTRVANKSDNDRKVTIRTLLLDDKNSVQAENESAVSISSGSTGETEQELTLSMPRLWSVDDPVMYKAVTEIVVDGNIVDNYTTPFGVRYFDFDVDKGFSLNGKPLKILGVCNHHDLGCLGAAINTRALERQLEILKDMGCNAIRTSHNPPAPELLDLCDRMGFLVQDEAFDMWEKGKSPFDYHLYWDEWHEKDLTDLVLRDRNHASVFMWSIGNELGEQLDARGAIITQELADIVRNLDTTRSVTVACNATFPGNKLIESGAMDVIGFNYHHNAYLTFKEKFPGQKLIGSETNSSVHTRGKYDMPSDSVRIWPIRWDRPIKGNPDFTCSAYDNCRVGWGSTHKATWKLVKNLDHVSGMFIWTGFDYLGEPTPYSWPARSSYFGLVDLCGFPKDAYYFYQSEWTDTPMLHLFPHWNWEPGKVVDVWAYTNCDSVELFLNNESLGKKGKAKDEFELVWSVPFTPGSLKAVASIDGKQVLAKQINTAEKPAKIILTADREQIAADGNDLSFVTVQIQDKDGNFVPDADNLVHFTIEGEGTIAGVDNGLQTSHESFRGNQRKAFNGLCLCIIRSTNNSGSVVLTANADGLEPMSVTISTR